MTNTARSSLQNATPVSTASGQFGSLGAYNLNDALMSARGNQMRDPWLIDVLQAEGWSKFRTDDSNLQTLQSNLKRILQQRTDLLKQSGFVADRDIAGYFTWNVIEPKKGEFNWNQTDALVHEAERADVKLSVVVQPFAAWDQVNTEANPGCKGPDFAYYDYKAGAPNDWGEYKNFLTQVAGRYNGKVATWEIGNEVEGSCGGYQNNAEGYVKLLNVSYETIKAADPRAKVLNGGALEAFGKAEAEETKSFWRKFFELGGGSYTDYFNLHYNAAKAGGVATDSASFTDNLAFYNGLMDQNGGRKPIWITEFGTYSGTPSQQLPPNAAGAQQQAGQPSASGDPQGQPRPTGQPSNGGAPPSGGGKCGDGVCDAFENQSGKCPTDCGGSVAGIGAPQSQEFQAAWYFKNSIIGFANGVDRIFIDFIGPDNQTIGASAAFTAKSEPRLFVITLKTISAKIGGFSKAEKISEGQYKFTVSNKSVYALWNGTLPKELSGQVNVTDFEGREKTVDAAQIELHPDQPVFVEPVSQVTTVNPR